ncbi:MAG: riboflavin synthase [Candidatus Bipolaricaulota bacterium]
MFTGIVRAVGKLAAREPNRIWVEHSGLRPEPGDSLAVNGVCLTVADVGSRALGLDLSPETLERTALGELRPGACVNLEPALGVGEPLGGHWVLGHVDCVGKVALLQRDGKARLVEVAHSPRFAPLLADKGAVAVDGISLTPFAVRRGGFRCAIVPQTWAHTNLQQRRVGDRVNLEFDILAKYVMSWRER